LLGPVLWIAAFSVTGLARIGAAGVLLMPTGQ
jgi:hypothetical protein